MADYYYNFCCWYYYDIYSFSLHVPLEKFLSHDMIALYNIMYYNLIIVLFVFLDLFFFCKVLLRTSGLGNS